MYLDNTSANMETNLNIWKIDVLQLALELHYVQVLHFRLKNLDQSNMK